VPNPLPQSIRWIKHQPAGDKTSSSRGHRLRTGADGCTSASYVEVCTPDGFVVFVVGKAYGDTVFDRSIQGLS
jgi:hypothetical protein